MNSIKTIVYIHIFNCTFTTIFNVQYTNAVISVTTKDCYVNVCVIPMNRLNHTCFTFHINVFIEMSSNLFRFRISTHKQGNKVMSAFVSFIHVMEYLRFFKFHTSNSLPNQITNDALIYSSNFVLNYLLFIEVP